MQVTTLQNDPPIKQSFFTSFIKENTCGFRKLTTASTSLHDSCNPQRPNST